MHPLQASQNKSGASAFSKDAYDNAKEALELDNQLSAAHKWVSITVAKVSKDTTEKIKNAFKIRDHALEAARLDPTDATPHHILGEWALNVASIGWFERKAAAALYASPPSATYDEALAHYLKVEELDPDFSVLNRARIVQVLLELKRKDEARKWMAKADELAARRPPGDTVQTKLRELRRKL